MRLFSLPSAKTYCQRQTNFLASVALAGTAERRAAEIMLSRLKPRRPGRRITVGEDKAYDTADHVANLRALNVTPHVTQNDSSTATGKRRQSAIDGPTTRHQGYGLRNLAA